MSRGKKRGGRWDSVTGGGFFSLCERKESGVKPAVGGRRGPFGSSLGGGPVTLLGGGKNVRPQVRREGRKKDKGELYGTKVMLKHSLRWERERSMLFSAQ